MLKNFSLSALSAEAYERNSLMRGLIFAMISTASDDR